eukprot:987732_1
MYNMRTIRPFENGRIAFLFGQICLHCSQNLHQRNGLINRQSQPDTIHFFHYVNMHLSTQSIKQHHDFTNSWSSFKAKMVSTSPQWTSYFNAKLVSTSPKWTSYFKAEMVSTSPLKTSYFNAKMVSTSPKRHHCA